MKKVVHLRSDISGPVKTVTIRDVNKNLYERFSSISTQFGDNTGQIFSHLIMSFGDTRRPMMMGLRHQHRVQTTTDPRAVEVISDLDELIVNKSDLQAAGEEMKYAFFKIGKLVFDETVDNKTLMKHILHIRKSKIESRGDISKLFLHSINQETNWELHYQGLDKESTNITIRNVSEQAYASFTAKCQERKEKIGDAVTELLKRAIPHFEIAQIMMRDPRASPLDTITLTMQPELEITNQDLLDLEGRKILLHRIGKLRIDDNVTLENFKDAILGIYNCDEVILPNHIPKLLRLARVKSISH